ncbi:hypothetical protein BGZ54_006030 [Gamsiella multidivaricata]|nr:hypothetical protein BGZ54_006030 [Gamsiella multidivaricata]
MSHSSSDMESYAALYFHKLQKLILTGWTKIRSHIYALLYRHTYLTELELVITDIWEPTTKDGPQLWKTIRTLPHLRALYVCDLGVHYVSGESWEMPALRSLKLHYTALQEKVGKQLESLARCRSLEYLEWYPAQVLCRTEIAEARGFVQMVEAGVWPELEGLAMHPSQLFFSDEDIALILAAMPRVTILDMGESNFGPLSFECLQTHFPIL